MARPTKHQKRYKNVGRPTVMTDEVLDKLEYGFRHSFSDREACLHAGISDDVLYKYQRENPEYIKRKEAFKLSPNIAAKETLVADIKTVNGARYWAEKKMPEDFMPQSKLILEGSMETTEKGTSDAIRTLTMEYEQKLREQIIAKDE